MRFVFYAAAAAQEAEHGKTLLIAHYRLAVDQTRPNLEVVDGLHHKGVAGCPVVAPAGNQPNADRVPSGQEPEAIVLNLVYPVRPCRRLWGGGGQAGLNKARPVSGQALTHTLDRHSAKIGVAWVEGESVHVKSR